jgi:outer membrane protein TolC
MLLLATLAITSNESVAAEPSIPSNAPIKTLIPSKHLDTSNLPQVTNPIEVVKPKEVTKPKEMIEPITNRPEPNHQATTILATPRPALGAKRFEISIPLELSTQAEDQSTYLLIPDSQLKIGREAIKPYRSFQQCRFAIFNENNAISLDDVLLKSLCQSETINTAIAAIEKAPLKLNLVEPEDQAKTSLSNSVSGSFNLSWILFDYSIRDENILIARKKLAAAIASQDKSTLNNISVTLNQYVDAYSAYSNLLALNHAKTIANISLDIVQKCNDYQLVDLSDLSKAKAAQMRISLERNLSHDVWLTKREQLALALNMPLQSALKLADSDLFYHTSDQSLTGTEIVAEAQTYHPHIIAANNKNTGYSLTKANILSNQAPHTDAEIPASDQAMQSSKAFISQINNEIWQQSIELKSTRESFIAAKQLLKVAAANYQASLTRYSSGAANIAGLLSAQSAFISAQKQVQMIKIALFKSRINLALATGRLSLAPTSN